MSITVKEIQEKEFDTVQANGYDADQVDDFLDALAEDWSAMLRENLNLTEQVHTLQDSVDAAKAANEELEKKLPDYNEKEYFQNLERSVREALIAAQRIADEAVNEAQRKAREIVENAQAQADRTVTEADERARVSADRAQQVVADRNAEVERLRGAIESYRAKLKTLLDEHMAILNSEDQN